VDQAPMSGRKSFFRPHLALSGERGVSATSQPAPFDPADAAPPTREQALRFRELMLPHLDDAYNLARFLSRDPTAAEDIVQEAFLRAFRSFPTYRGGSPKAWLFAIVRNCFLNWIRVNRRWGEVLVDESALSESESAALTNVADADEDTPEQALMRRREAETVRAVIEKLPEPFRETLVLREIEELSYKEIAVLTDAPIGTVMSRLARARQMLTELLLPLLAATNSMQTREAQP
jgi:RNA polymerase sigma factor (sigma-70 family)